MILSTGGVQDIMMAWILKRVVNTELRYHNKTALRKTDL